ncbi:MAG: Maf family protein [bacterium]|nr:Maf family protein [bacterium]
MTSQNRRLILASSSPRRRQLLTDAGYHFEVIPPSMKAECGMCSGETPPEMVARLARQKATDVAVDIDQGLVIGCDTLAECMGRTLGKPTSREHAREMLLLMRGRVHHVYSGLCIWQRPSNRFDVKVDSTKLKMGPVTDQQLEDYLDTDLWEGKAGAFGYQDGNDWIEILGGSETNVVGLPMELLKEMLAKAGWQAG